MFLKITNLGRSCKVAEHGRIYDVGLFRVTVSLNLSCISHNSRLSLNFTPSPIHNPSASLLPSVPPLLLPIYPNLCHSTLSLISSPSIPKHPSSFPPCSPPPNLHPVSLSLSVSLSHLLCQYWSVTFHWGGGETTLSRYSLASIKCC